MELQYFCSLPRQRVIILHLLTLKTNILVRGCLIASHYHMCLQSLKYALVLTEVPQARVNSPHTAKFGFFW